MTEIKIIGEEKIKSNLKPIRFEKYLDNNTLCGVCCNVSSWKDIELIKKNRGFDLIFAYDDKRSTGLLYLGQWNDGIVEND